MINPITEEEVRALVSEIVAELGLGPKLAMQVNAIVRHRLMRYLAGETRRKLQPGSDMAVHHIDGNPFNTDPANLRLVPMRERGMQ